ncbi:MAG: hypothetical protein ACI9EF_000241 [Pseudohongiellaceae bacterium]|jgi:hypothetical protein
MKTTRPFYRRLALLSLVALFTPSTAALAQDDVAAVPPAEAPAEPEPPRFWSASEEAEPRGLRVAAEPEAFAGYTLFAPLNSQAVHLIDMAGELVHSWATDSAPGAWAYLLDDGRLLRCGRKDEDPQFKGGGIGGIIQTLAPDGTVLWNWEFADEQQQQHHDVEPLPNGNLLVISWERLTGVEAIGLGRDPREVSRRGFWPDMLLEVRPVMPDSVEIVWEWHAADHLVQDFDEHKPNYGLIAEHPELIDINGDHRDAPPLTVVEIAEQQALEDHMRALGYVGGDDEEDDADEQDEPGRDWLHTNAVDYHAELDLIVLSTPHFSELWVIDHSTTTEEAGSHKGGRWGHGGDLLWRWGHPRRYGAGSDDDQQLFYQHDPSWLPGAAEEGLRLLVFNNGRGRADGDYSSVDELLLPFTVEHGFEREAGQAFGPEQPSWSYSAGEDFYSAFISGAERLLNGNTLICSGAPGRLFEVTADGRIVWDYRNPLGGDVDPPEHAGRAPPLSLFRGARYSLKHPGVAAVLR